MHYFENFAYDPKGGALIEVWLYNYLDAILLKRLKSVKNKNKSDNIKISELIIDYPSRFVYIEP